MKLYTNIHDAYHTLFGTMIIKPALEQVLAINNSALTTQFKRDLYKILQEEDIDYYYKK